MKITAKGDTDFKPVKVEFTLESQSEVDMLYAIFNHATITGFTEARGLDDGKIRDALIPFISGDVHKIHSALCTKL